MVKLSNQSKSCSVAGPGGKCQAAAVRNPRRGYHAWALLVETDVSTRPKAEPTALVSTMPVVGRSCAPGCEYCDFVCFLDLTLRGRTRMARPDEYASFSDLPLAQAVGEDSGTGHPTEAEPHAVDAVEAVRVSLSDDAEEATMRGPGALLGESGLLPPARREAEWNFSLFGRCCVMNAACCMAWTLPCVPVAQMFEKTTLVGFSACGEDVGYSRFLQLFLMLLVIQLIVFVATGASIPFPFLFLAVAVSQLRGVVRQLYHIPGGGVSDCLVSWCCLPCAVTQLSGQVWTAPDVVPGCDCSSHPAECV